LPSYFTIALYDLYRLTCYLTLYTLVLKVQRILNSTSFPATTCNTTKSLPVTRRGDKLSTDCWYCSFLLCCTYGIEELGVSQLSYWAIVLFTISSFTWSVWAQKLRWNRSLK